MKFADDQGMYVRGNADGCDYGQGWDFDTVGSMMGIGIQQSMSLRIRSSVASMMPGMDMTQVMAMGTTRNWMVIRCIWTRDFTCDKGPGGMRYLAGYTGIHGSFNG